MMTSKMTSKMPSKTINKHTVQYSMLRNIKTISDRFDIKQRDLMSYLFTEQKEDDITTEKHFYSAMLYLSEYHNAEMRHLGSRPRKGHTGGECYSNAYEEWKATGNEPVMVMEVLNIRGKYYSICPHGCNKDKKTGELYDTATYVSGKEKKSRPCFIVRDTNEMKIWLTHLRKNEKHLIDTPTMTIGHLDLVIFNNNLYAIKTLKTNPGKDNNETVVVSILSKSVDELLTLRSKYL